MSLTCRAIAPISRARLFYSVQFLPGANNGVEVELSRLRKLDALFTSNPMLPTYVRKFEFGNIQSKLLWFTGEPLARILNSLTQLKIFLITGPYPNMDWDDFDEEVKSACIRASARPTLEKLEVSGIMNLPTAFIIEAVQITWLYLVDAQLIDGDPAPFARSEPQLRRDLKTLIYQSCDETPRLLLQQISQPGCRFDLSTLQRFEIVSGSADELMVAWSIAALAKGSLRKLVIPLPEIDPCSEWPFFIIPSKLQFPLIGIRSPFSRCNPWDRHFFRVTQLAHRSWARWFLSAVEKRNVSQTRKCWYWNLPPTQRVWEEISWTPCHRH